MIRSNDSAADAFFASVLSGNPEELALLTRSYGVREEASPITRTTRVDADAKALITPKPLKTGTRVASQGVKRKLRDGSVKPAKAPRAPNLPAGMTALPVASSLSTLAAIVELTPAPQGAAPIRPGFNLPKAGSIGADDFIAALRTAGRRQATTQVEKSVEVESVDEFGEITKSVETVLETEFRVGTQGRPIFVTDGLLQMQDERAAIAAFVGYDVTEPHGSQLDAARLTANTRLSHQAHLAAGTRVEGAPYRSPEARSALDSLLGYVAGMPNPVRKLYFDLKGREEIATTDLITYGNLRTFAQTGAVADYNKIIAKEFPSSRGVKPTYNEAGEENGYENVVVPHPIAVTLAGLKGEALTNLLAQLEALAFARKDAIRQDLAGLNSDKPTDAQITAAHAVILGRGMPLIEDEIMLLDTTPKA